MATSTILCLERSKDSFKNPSHDIHIVRNDGRKLKRIIPSVF
jgi:hypothetical protein